METIFDLFGIEAPNNEEEKKKVGSKKQSKEEFKLPLVLNFGGLERIISSEGEGRDKIGAKRLTEIIENHFECCPSDIIETNLKKDVLYITYRDAGIQKGMINIDENTRFLFGDIEIDFPHEDSEIDVTVLQEAFKKMFNECLTLSSKKWRQISILQSKSNILVPVFSLEKCFSVPVSDQVIFMLPNLEKITYSADECRSSKQEADNNSDNNATDSALPKVQLSVKDIADLLKQKELNESWDFRNKIAVCETDKKNTYIIWMEHLPKARNTKNETLFPVDGVTLSVLYESYTLKMEDFEGKTMVTQKELIDFLIRNGHPEYSFVDGIRAKYEKSRNMIVVIASGSSKGMLPLTVKTPFFSYGKEGFRWLIKKIPMGLYTYGENLCRYVTSKYGTEVCLNLYYSIQSDNFFWYIPEQVATKSTVQIANDSYLDTTSLSGLLKIGQFHSHGEYLAFFSETDNADEIFPGIYGVWGSFTKGVVTFRLRCVGGYKEFWEIDKKEVFDEDSQYSAWPGIFECVDQRLVISPREPLYEVAEIEGKEILIIRNAFIYLSLVFRHCTDLLVYFVCADGDRLYISEDAYKAVVCIVSKHVIDSSSLQTLRTSSERMTILNYCLKGE